MNEENAVTATNRLLYRAWAPTDVQDTDDALPRQLHVRGTGPWLAAAPMLLALALVLGGALVVGATAKATTGPSHAKDVPVAGAEQMRRQAQAAVQAFQARQYAEAYGRFAALADADDAPSALIALAMVRHGPTLFGSEWSLTRAQVQHWSALALQDVHERGAVIAEHDRGE